jgi:hypothetical protein
MGKAKSIIILIIGPMLAFGLSALVLWLVLHTTLPVNKILFWGVLMSARIILLFAAILLLIRLFYKYVIQSKLFSKPTEGFFTAYYMLFILILFGEIITTFIVKTNNVEHSLSTYNWYVLHGGPKNSNQFRDEEFTMKKDKLAVFLGDSFTKGFGINNYKKRYSNIIEQNTEYETWNMGVQGADATTYIGLLQHSTKYIPDVLFVQFYFNDITTSGNRFNIYYQSDEKPSNYNVELLKVSYLVNQFYCYQQINKSSKSDYIEYIDQLVLNQEVWLDHSTDVQNIKRLCDSLRTDLRAIVFPYLIDPSLSHNYTESLKAVLDSLRVPTIHVEDLIEDLTVKQRIVNKNDPHASALVNQRLAEKIIEMLSQKEY